MCKHRQCSWRRFKIAWLAETSIGRCRRMRILSWSSQNDWRRNSVYFTTANIHSTPADLHFHASVLWISDSTCFRGTTHFVRIVQSGRDRAHTQPLSRTSGVRFWNALFRRTLSKKRANYSSRSTASWSRSILSRWRTVRTGLLLATGTSVSVALVNSRNCCISNCSSATSSREGNNTVLDNCRDLTNLAVELHYSTSRSRNY